MTNTIMRRDELMVKVIKKDGREVDYNEENIKNNLDSAERVFGVQFKRDKGDIIQSITQQVSAQTHITSQDIFKIVESELQDDKPILSAFREYKKQEQEDIDKAMDIDYQLKRLELKDSSIINENGNKDTRTFSTQRDLLATVVTKAKSLQCYPEDVRRMHLKGAIHLHDLDRSPFHGLANCSLPDFPYMLKNGFQLGDAWIESPKSIGVAATILTQLLSTMSGSQYGGLSVHLIDEVLKPYAQLTHDKNKELYREVLTDESKVEEYAWARTKKDIYDACQTMEYQINTMSTSTSQPPFTTVSLSTSTDRYSREIQKAILNVRKEGLGPNKVTAIFPKIIYFIDEGINQQEGDPNYDIKQLAMETSARRTYPDMVSVPKLRELKGCQEPITPMGCRSYLQYWEDEFGQETYYGRQNLGVVSINLPRIGIKSGGHIDTLWLELDTVLDSVRKALHVREDSVLESDIENAPLFYKYGGYGDPTGKESVKDFYTGVNRKRSTISIGYVGIHNMMVALTGETHWQDNPQYQKLSVDILKHLDDYANSIQDEFNAYVSVYATPSESLASRFEELDNRRFGVINGVTDDEYYENSFHYPSKFGGNAFHKIEFESQYIPYTNGGYMHYVEKESSLYDDNPKGYELLWDMAYDNVCYFGINIANDQCFECGSTKEFKSTAHGYECSECGNTDPDQMDVVRRLCGYLGKPAQRKVVKGKHKEIASRKNHD